MLYNFAYLKYMIKHFTLNIISCHEIFLEYMKYIRPLFGGKFMNIVVSIYLRVGVTLRTNCYEDFQESHFLFENYN